MSGSYAHYPAPKILCEPASMTQGSQETCGCRHLHHSVAFTAIDFHRRCGVSGGENGIFSNRDQHRGAFSRTRDSVEDRGMNKSVNKLYTDYLELTGDNAAAAALTLADVMQRTLDAPKTESAAPITMTPGKPLTVPEVAKFLQVAPTKIRAWIRSRAPARLQCRGDRGRSAQVSGQSRRLGSLHEASRSGATSRSRPPFRPFAAGGARVAGSGQGEDCAGEGGKSQA